MLKRIRIGAKWLDWPVRQMLRRHGLPDVPEVRRTLRAWARKGWTLGAAPSRDELRALHDKAVSAAIRALGDEVGQ